RGKWLCSIYGLGKWFYIIYGRVKRFTVNCLDNTDTSSPSSLSSRPDDTLIEYHHIH
ncbi:unnamed protein product, partial [Rotaria sordida]